MKLQYEWVGKKKKLVLVALMMCNFDRAEHDLNGIRLVAQLKN